MANLKDILLCQFVLSLSDSRFVKIIAKYVLLTFFIRFLGVFLFSLHIIGVLVTCSILMISVLHVLDPWFLLLELHINFDTSTLGLISTL